MELADMPDLGSGGRPCKFDPCQAHHKKALLFDSEEPFSYAFPVGMEIV